MLKFDVPLHGMPTNIEVVKSPYEAFSKEAIRIVEEGGVWKPAKNTGGEYEEAVRLRVVFRR
mgnify:CR=1 FL=1